MSSPYSRKIINNFMNAIFSFLIETAHASGNLGSSLGKLRDSGVTAGTSQIGDAGVVIGNIIGTALSFVGTIFLVLAVYGGYIWMTAQGAEDKVAKAQKIIQGAVIGLVIVVSAYAITFTVGARFSGSAPADQDFGGVCCEILLDDGTTRGEFVADEFACAEFEAAPGVTSAVITSDESVCLQ